MMWSLLKKSLFYQFVILSVGVNSPVKASVLEMTYNPSYLQDNQVEQNAQSSCQKDYEIGEIRTLLVPLPWGYGLPFSNFYSKYKVQRKSRIDYEVSVALDFSPHWSYTDGPVPTDQVHRHYLRHARSCVDSANLRMTGPHGEKLRIAIEDGRSSHVIAPIHFAQIKNLRTINFHLPSNFRNYDINIDCPSLFHELLHIFGFNDTKRVSLWDFLPAEFEFPDIPHFSNFPELLTSYIYNDDLFDCRVTQIDSIMSAVFHRWNRILRNRNTKESLLDPVHFNAIIYGHCLERPDVALFRQCDRLGYRSSFFDRSCLAQKAYCERQNVLGRDKRAELQRYNDRLEYVQERIQQIKADTNSNAPITCDHSLRRDECLLDVEQEEQDILRRIKIIQDWPES